MRTGNDTNDNVRKVRIHKINDFITRVSVMSGCVDIPYVKRFGALEKFTRGYRDMHHILFGHHRLDMLHFTVR